MKRYTQREVEQLGSKQFRQTTGWLRSRGKEWNAAWKGLAERSGDTDYVGEHRGEAWQYMGSDSWTGQWTHHFRHRDHKRLGYYARIRVPASPGWTPQQEAVKRKPKPTTH